MREVRVGCGSTEGDFDGVGFRGGMGLIPSQRASERYKGSEMQERANERASVGGDGSPSACMIRSLGREMDDTYIEIDRTDYLLEAE